MRDLVPIREAAVEFGVTRVTLHRYIRKGRLTGYKKGLDVRTFIDREELRRLAEPRPLKASPGEG
ncbi:MAG: helix-turn-helix domain-containing protein [Candidatus Dormibacteria bacterium]